MTRIYQYFSNGFQSNVHVTYQDGILVKVEISEPKPEGDVPTANWYIKEEAFVNSCHKYKIPFTEIKREVTFEMFWKRYNYSASGKIPAHKAWNKLTEAEQQQAYDHIPLYESHLKQAQTAKKYGSTYLNSKIYIK